MAGGAPKVSESKDLTSNDSTKAVTAGVANVTIKEKAELSVKPVIATSGTTKKAASKSATSPEFVELTEDVAATRKSVGEKSRYLPSISVESTPANSDSGYVHPVPTSTTSSSKGFTDKIDDITPDSKRFLRGV